MDDYNPEDPRGAGKAVNAAYEAFQDRRDDDEDDANDDELGDAVTALDDEVEADDDGRAVEDWNTSPADAVEDTFSTDDPADAPDNPDDSAPDHLQIPGVPPLEERTYGSGGEDDLAIENIGEQSPEDADLPV